MKSFYQKFGAWGRSTPWCWALCSGGAAGLVAVGDAGAAIVYSGQKNIGITSDFNGVFINVTALQSTTPANGSWDLNPFFGGLGIANSPGFQPVRSGTANEAPILALTLGASVGGSLTYSSGWGGSGAEDDSGHLGTGAGQFTAGQTGYLGFKLLSGTDVNYGWMRVNLTSNGATGSVIDWAYDNSGSPILAGAEADLGAAPMVRPAGTELTLSASQAGTGLLTGEGAKITFNEGTTGGIYAGSIQGAGEIKIAGAGTLTLSGSNRHTGGTTLTAGSLAINNPNALGSGALTIGGGTTIDNTSGAAITLGSANPVNLNGNFTFGGSNDLNLGSGAVTLSTNPQFTLNGTSTLTIGGAIGGASDLTITGTGQIVVAGNNSYTGDTSISGGATFTILGNNGLGASDGNTMVSNGSSLVLSNVNYTTAEPLILHGQGSGGNGALVNTGTSSFAGPITAATDSTINGGTGTLNLSGGIDKTGTVLTLANGTFNLGGSGITGNSGIPDSDLIVDGGTLNLNVANTYFGPTYLVNAGTINANAADALPTAGGRSVMTLDATGSGGSTLALVEGQAVASLTGAASSMVNLGSKALTMGTATGTTTFAGVLSGAGGSVIKDGSSIQVLTNTNSYTGITTVSSGTLIIHGDHTAATGAVTVAAGATLAGSGTLGGALTVDGIFAPGTSPGTMTTSGPVTFGAASVLNYELAGNNLTVGGGVNDLLTGVTNLTLGGTLNVTEIGAGLFLLANLGDRWRIMDYSGTLTGTLSINTVPALSVPAWSLAVDTTTTNQVNLMVVPETSAVSLLGLATLFTLHRRRISRAA